MKTLIERKSVMSLKNGFKRINHILFNHFKNQDDLAAISKIIKDEDFLPIECIMPKHKNRLIFVTYHITRHSGGITSILRLGSELNRLGYEVAYTAYSGQQKTEMIANAKINLSNYEGEMIDFAEAKKQEGIIFIATNWESAYVIKKLNGYKMYFVQDYEPYFYAFGEFYLLAKKSYELGYHMVSLGAWNIHKIKTECGIDGFDHIDFPYEAGEYRLVDRDFKAYKNKKAFQLAVYIKPDGKRIPNIIQLMLKQVCEAFAQQGITMNILFYGLNKKHPVLIGTNLGKLNKKELEKLYQTSDFGMVASMTNISLVPYEMMATGLPLIEFEEGTFKDFFPTTCAILTSYSAHDLYQKLDHAIQDPSLLIKMHENAQRQLNALSWKKSARQFADILDRL